jgi:hypothetical protein
MSTRQKNNILSCMLAVALAFIVTVSCDTYPITITPVLIEEGWEFGGSAGNFVIKTQAEWDNWICSGFFDPEACSQEFAERNFNFDMFQIIAVIDQGRPNCCGWSINIISIKEYSNDIVVSIRIKDKGSIFDMLTRPYQIVKIPVTAKDVVFKYIS